VKPDDYFNRTRRLRKENIITPRPIRLDSFSSTESNRMTKYHTTETLRYRLAPEGQPCSIARIRLLFAEGRLPEPATSASNRGRSYMWTYEQIDEAVERDPYLIAYSSPKTPPKPKAKPKPKPEPEIKPSKSRKPMQNWGVK
jgi:hypothetical protein